MSNSNGTRDLAARSVRQYGMFRRSDALECGFDDNDIIRRIRTQRWHRLRRGRYVEGELWRSLDSDARFELEVRAVVSRMIPPLAVSHWSAARLLGLQTHDPECHIIQVTRAGDRVAKLEDGVRQHHARLADSELTTVRGIPVTTAERTVVDLGRFASFESALVTADSALRKAVTRDELDAQLQSHRYWPGVRDAAMVVAEADGRAESVGESLARNVFRVIGLPPPELQMTFTDDRGKEVARCDFGWSQFRTVGEFDGKMKYQRGAAGLSATDAVIAEKKREEWLHTVQGHLMIRLTWTDLYPDRYAAVYETAIRTFHQAARLHQLPAPDLPSRYLTGS